MTEEEAKTKWCPMVQQRGATPGAAADLAAAEAQEAGAGALPNRNCIASGCMMWRTYTVEYAVTPADAELNIKRQKQGWCGLAGPL